MQQEAITVERIQEYPEYTTDNEQEMHMVGTLTTVMSEKQDRRRISGHLESASF